jgi:hypothetical protein
MEVFTRNAFCESTEVAPIALYIPYTGIALFPRNFCYNNMEPNFYIGISAKEGMERLLD